MNKSCVAVADADKDGDTDIFVGTLADAKAYGIPQSSHLLLNDGKGNFEIAADDVIQLKNIGMVTSAAFTDINNDGWMDIVVAGEWMPLTIYTNRNGKFTKTVVPNSSGLWQTVFADDVNGDGNKDILAGNWGLNNKFSSGKNGPLRLYVADYDNNGRMDQLMSYTLNGEEYPFLAKDEVERALPLLKKHYLRYAEYAGVIMKDVFYGWVDTIKPVMAEKLASVVCYGDGKGNFGMNDLPAELQLSPIMTFQKMPGSGKNVYISGGNFFDVIPYEGRYDAQALAVFSAKNDEEISVYPPQSVYQYNGQVRDLKWLNTKQEKLLLVAGNNDSLRCLGFRSLN
jgi:hypothetical protein